MSVPYYAALLAGDRLDAFRRGIADAVHPGDRVLDLGTGLGTFAQFAARAGAASVCALDRDPIVHVAEELARANGVTRGIEWVRADAATWRPPARFDVLVFEDFPRLLLDGATHALLARVQRDLLVAGARMVPGRARLRVAPVRSPRHRARAFPPVLDERGLGIDWSALRPYLANAVGRDDVLPGDLIARPQGTAWVPLLPVPSAGALRVAAAWEGIPDGPVHALALWFDLEVAEGVVVSNEPRPDPEPWGQTLLPLDPPLEIGPGGRLEVEVAREALADGAPGWLVWTARAGGERRAGHQFASLALGPADLGRADAVDIDADAPREGS